METDFSLTSQSHNNSFTLDNNSRDNIRIFVENPLQNTNALHIKMKMPPKVFCMRVNRAALSLS